jgi:polyferredoxin
MEKVNLPKGLIRYASEDNIEKKTKFSFTPRMMGYSSVLVVLIGVLIGMLFLRNDLEATVLRLPGQMYERKEGNIISNVYTFKLINKTTKNVENVSFKLLSHNGKIEVVTHKNFDVPAEQLTEGTLFIEIDAGELGSDKDKLKIGVYSDETLLETATTRFLGPRSYY